ncbi:hypothetical protein BGX26_003524 [Mortierella sp. AD094]|nr:hypothetical protein BGX26_003524 [Mortierella sp. AD094]
MFEDTNQDTVLTKDGDTFMDDNSNFQTAKLEIFENQTFVSSQEQKGVTMHSEEHIYGPKVHILQLSSPLHSAGTGLSIKPPSFDMYKPSLDPYLSASGYGTSDNSSKSITPMDQAMDEPSSRTLSQDEDSSSSMVCSNMSGQHDITFQYSADMQITASPAHSTQQQLQRQQLLGALNGLPPQPSSLISTDTGSADNSELPEDIAIRRAEQNRAAQRAFRQRKQKYIKWLESKAEELDEVYRIMALVRVENQQLCNLVMELNMKLSSSNRGTADSNSTSDSATAMASEDLGSSAGLKSKLIQGIDESLGKEISMRLMNLAGLGTNEDCDALDKNKFLPRSSSQSKWGTGFEPTKQHAVDELLTVCGNHYKYFDFSSTDILSTKFAFIIVSWHCWADKHATQYQSQSYIKDK